MKIANICDRIIEYSFYLLFLFVPLAIAGDTSELFEFNKMWLTFGLTILIASAWTVKSITKKQLRIQRTPLDIPIFLFLLSQIISTIFSWDTHISIWGYYSRFNGGLLSIISYIFLYYAFVSNFLTNGKQETSGPVLSTLTAKMMTKRILFVSLASGLIVSLWGLPSHFGYDPTCFVFRGTLDVSCWTADFQPKIRIFSTLGQPDWLAAYLAILIPISIVLFIKNFKSQIVKGRFSILNFHFSTVFYLLIFILFYFDLLYSRSRSGILGVWISIIILLVLLWFFGKKFFQKSSIAILAIVLFFVALFAGQPFVNLDKFTLGGSKSNSASTAQINNVSKAKPDSPHIGELGGTDSGKIRLLVWNGAIEAWKHYPIFGTGVETFAFAYYRYKSPAHNLTSEWNFLYNKAHNEYLNYLATTGAFGLGAYLFMIGSFLFIALSKVYKISKSQISHPVNLFSLALIVAYISILISNFFGFSVVIVNIYLFMIPAFVLILEEMIDVGKMFVMPRLGSTDILSPFQWVGISLIVLISLYLIYTSLAFWNADKSYAYGSNLNKAGLYQQAYPYLHKAVSQRGNEPVFKDELSVNDAILAAGLLGNKNAKIATEAAATASSLAQEAITTSNEVVGSSSNNVVFWKTRVKIFYVLSQIDSRFFPMALSSIQRASQLAPADANISYNLGVLYGQNGNIDKAIEVLSSTVKLKPDYRDAYYALGLFYHEKAIDKTGKVILPSAEKKAVEQMEYILKNVLPNDAPAKEAIKSWGG
ncbi:MAG: O-antigen ligase family protein [Patescibacteria group bacterium]|nr:O-antigen ligase family protein [Patescibacteria group bacterium]